MHVKVIREMKSQFLYQNKVEYDLALLEIGVILFHFQFIRRQWRSALYMAGFQSISYWNC